MKSPIHPLLNPLITLAITIGVVYILIVQKTFFIPIILGFFIALLLLPAVKKLESWRIPRIASNLIMIILAVLALSGILVVVSLAISQFINQIPNYQSIIAQNMVGIQDFIARTFGISVYEQGVWINQNINFTQLGAKNVGTIISTAGTGAVNIGLTFIYTFFILYYRDKLRSFLQKLLGGSAEESILAVMKKIGKIIPAYLTGVLQVVLILAVLISFGLWIIGVDNALFWGISIALLNVIPYIGTAIGFGALVIFTFLTQGIPLAIGAIVIFIITQFIDNNILTPTIAGGTIDINPLAAIIGLLLIGSAWGTTGLILAIPIVGMIKVICDSIPEYNAWGYLLGNEGTEEHALSWHNIKKFFRRK